MNNPDRVCSHDDLRMLLPWYVNGTVSEMEAETLRHHLESCPECRDDLAVHKAMQRSVAREGTTPMVPARTAASVIDGAGDSAPTNAFWSARTNIAAAAALVLAIVATALTLQAELGGADSNKEFETATSAGTEPGMRYVLRVEFEAHISAESRTRVITELGGVDARELDDADVYEILVQLQDASLDELERIAYDARERQEVREAEFVALQLPVR